MFCIRATDEFTWWYSFNYSTTTARFFLSPARRGHAWSRAGVKEKRAALHPEQTPQRESFIHPTRAAKCKGKRLAFRLTFSTLVGHGGSGSKIAMS